ncbi:BON domain-containing protein [Gilvimarinus agarilyticus]|uniref:BON domain-containing protein n=1 Tax=Gilvimarinus agarilyticus TaxID=679259 RepID=UPI0005A1C876|nr:BON domain-containing protein [Gilvimarinus agarilyticus]
MNTPERHSLQHMIAPVTSVALVTAFSVSTAIGANSKSAYADKPSAKDYWAEFSQDSGQSWESSQEAFRDGWIEGRLDAALSLNEHLNTFELQANVSASTATLTGAVANEIDKELATNVAMGVEGIEKVDNQLTVDQSLTHDSDEESGRNFAEYLSDMSTTAAIKTELLASSNINGIGIDVDTYHNEVTLTGSVASEAQLKLAEALVTKHPDIDKVHNKLSVAP